jgi:hypothetical protein
VILGRANDPALIWSSVTGTFVAAIRGAPGRAVAGERSLVQPCRLDHELRRRRGHAALWLSSEAEAQSALDQGPAFCPTIRMLLPKGIDVLWAFLAPIVLRYDGAWSAAWIEVASRRADGKP